ncbi:MAG TPA: hypothetical protein VEM96_18215 [Pyrinomonadaceae bacterium]|nr:hypothetical protein [Pyrinomonadaceae bacterium]
MKHCPKCDFTFADFYNVCEFDGAELVDDPERPPSSVRASPPPSRFRRVLKSPVFFTGLLVLAVLASALMIGYYDSVNQSNSIAGNQPSQNSSVSPVLPTQSSVQPPAQIKTPATSSGVSALSNSKRTEKSSSTSRSPSRSTLSSNARRPTIASRSRARLHSPTSARNQPGKSQTALQRESKDTANKKEPKLTAMLKTTWNILKKPFKF